MYQSSTACKITAGTDHIISQATAVLLSCGTNAGFKRQEEPVGLGPIGAQQLTMNQKKTLPALQPVTPPVPQPESHLYDQSLHHRSNARGSYNDSCRSLCKSTVLSMWRCSSFLGAKISLVSCANLLTGDLWASPMTGCHLDPSTAWTELQRRCARRCLEMLMYQTAQHTRPRTLEQPTRPATMHWLPARSGPTCNTEVSPPDTSAARAHQ